MTRALNRMTAFSVLFSVFLCVAEWTLIPLVFQEAIK